MYKVFQCLTSTERNRVTRRLKTFREISDATNKAVELKRTGAMTKYDQSDDEGVVRNARQ
jgi:hypothetical protein